MDEKMARREFPIWASLPPVSASMHTESKIKKLGKAIGGVLLMALASIRVQTERIKGSRKAKNVCAGILAVLVLVLNSLIAFRVAQRDAQRSFEAWQTRYVNDFISQQEAAERGMPPDPKEELRGQQATAFARLMSGLKLYGFGLDDYRTLAQGIACRVANPAYPNTVVEVIEQPQQWPGYSESNEVTQKDYALAVQILGEIEAQEHPAISQDFVYASFEREGITLRDTWDIGTRTKFWRYGE